MKLSDIPPEQARDLFGGIVERFSSAKDRHPFRRLRTEVHLSVEDARIVYAGWKWLERYLNWQQEAEKGSGKVGVEETEPPLRAVVSRLGVLVSSISGDERVLVLGEKDMAVIETAALHLDRYAITLAFNEPRRGKRK